MKPFYLLDMLNDDKDTNKYSYYLTCNRICYKTKFNPYKEEKKLYKCKLNNNSNSHILIKKNKSSDYILINRYCYELTENDYMYKVIRTNDYMLSLITFFDDYREDYNYILYKYKIDIKNFTIKLIENKKYCRLNKINN